MLDWQSLLRSERYAFGKANPALFFNRQRNWRGAVHGDDFLQTGLQLINYIGKVLASKYEVRKSHQPGVGKPLHIGSNGFEHDHSLYKVRVKDTDSFRSSQAHDTLN